MIRNGCWSPKPRSRKDFCSKDQRIHWLEIETRSASPLHSLCLPTVIYLAHTHTEWIVFHHQNQVHTTLRLMTFTSLFCSDSYQLISRTNKKRLKVRFASHFTTLMRPLFRLNRSVFDGSKFFSPFFASAWCLNASRHQFESLLNLRLACFSIENTPASTLIRIGLETHNNVHGN